MIIHFLHLSDMHYRVNWEEEVDVVVKAFKDDLSKQIRHYPGAFLIFSGDHVQAGADTKLFDAFKTDFDQVLTTCGITLDRRISVPGNHDISRAALADVAFMQRGALLGTTSEYQFNERFTHLCSHFFQKTFAPYVQFESSFARYGACQTSLGGAGWSISDEVGVYCLNSALSSFGGLTDDAGNPSDDKGRLVIDSRSLYRWLDETKYKTTILVVHHPLDWLTNWARIELEKIIENSFNLVFSGHLHHPTSIFTSRGAKGTVFCSAPPLFTHKKDLLGYAFVTVNTDDSSAVITYRQWSSIHRTFVTGSSISGSDDGMIRFPGALGEQIAVEVLRPEDTDGTTLARLQSEFDQARTCYSSKKQFWVQRDLASAPETEASRDDPETTTPDDVAKDFRDCVIRAPKEFGLTTLGRYIALQYYKENGNLKSVAVLDAREIPPHRQGLLQYVENRRKYLMISAEGLSGLILDSWSGGKNTHKLVKLIKHEYPRLPLIVLQGLDDSEQIGSSLVSEELRPFPVLFLWSLSQARIRELVESFTSGNDALDEAVVTRKVTSDIDALNIHRTPLNCLLLLKLAEQAFDDSPVNRTEMIGRVLNILFYGFNKVPTYATKPDLKDCEYALGYFCEWLIRNSRNIFLKKDFDEQVRAYCQSQLLDLDTDILFNFLLSENIFIQKGFEYGFRFSYWLYYFAAHRMHHDPAFCEFIFSDRRYAAFPGIMEFYAGIDRRRTDAVVRLTADLSVMNSQFLARTGIVADFNPLGQFQWNPSAGELEYLQKEVKESMGESSLPPAVKDAIADRDYDRSKPYKQELAKFISESTLNQMVSAMKGAARVLRNSDHVLPVEKSKLLEEIMTCWMRVAQILMILSPVLAVQKKAEFEDMGFYLVERDFNQFKDEAERWNVLMLNIPHNIVKWYQEDLFSKKMAALLTKFLDEHRGDLTELFLIMVLIRQKPVGWQNKVEEFIIRNNKDSFFLNRVFTTLRSEHSLGFCSERAKLSVRKLYCMALAKHEVGVKHPNSKLIDKVAKSLDEVDDKAKGKKDGSAPAA